MSCAFPMLRQRGALSTGSMPTRFVIAEVFSKKTKVTPPEVIKTSHRRLRAYDAAAAGEGES